VLERLLDEIRNSDGPVSFADLSSRLEVERSALEPMLELLVRRGLLTEWMQKGCEVACSMGSCGSSCSGFDGCPFVVGGGPRTLEVTRETP
jgi:hypothetical protein